VPDRFGLEAAPCCPALSQEVALSYTRQNNFSISLASGLAAKERKT